MFSYLEKLPPADRAAELTRINEGLKSGTFDPVPYYRNAALTRASRQHAEAMTSSVTIITLAVFLATPFIGFEIAIFAGLMFFAQSFINARRAKEAVYAAMEEDQDFTPFLSGNERREYLRVSQNMMQSSGKALPFSPEAQAGHPVVEGYVQPPLPQPQSVGAPPNEEPRSVAPIGPETKLRAIPVAAAPVQEQPIAPPAPVQPIAPPVIPTSTVRFFDAKSLALNQYVETILWLGGSQSGKTMAADQLGRELRRMYQENLRAYYITPVYRPNELNRFDWCDKVLRFPLLNEYDPDTIASVYEQYEQLLDEFLSLPSHVGYPKLFICDELTIHALKACGTKGMKNGNESALKFYGKFINALNANASGGKGEGIALWGLSPSGAVDAIGISRSGMSAAVPVFIGPVSGWNGAVWRGAKDNKLAPEQEPTPEMFAALKAKGVNRLISVGCQPWLPLMEYEVAKAAMEPIAVSSPARSMAEVRPQEQIPSSVEVEDPAMELISDVSDRDKREALMIAYQWATKRLAEGKTVDKELFMQRARNERRCAYLKEQREEIWSELSTLIG